VGAVFASALRGGGAAELAQLQALYAAAGSGRVVPHNTSFHPR